MVVHLQTFEEELKVLKENNIDFKGRILLSDRAHVLFDYHKKLTGSRKKTKGSQKVGTTLRGIGPAYTDKIKRTGIRLGEILDFEKFSKERKKTSRCGKKCTEGSNTTSTRSFWNSRKSRTKSRHT